MPEDLAEAVQSYQKGADLGMSYSPIIANVAKCLDPVLVNGSPDSYFCLCGCANVFLSTKQNKNK